MYFACGWHRCLLYLPVYPGVLLKMSRAVASVAAAALAGCGTVENHTTYNAGRILGNITFDLPAEAIPSTCCAVATSFARGRSQNSTKGLPWTATILGPGKTHPGQLSVMCEAFDYGATSSKREEAVSGITGVLPPFPAPPPRCESFEKRQLCPDRCFWSDAGKCTESTPIPCGANTMQGKDNAPLCVHVGFNSSDINVLSGGTFFNITLDENATVLSAPPKSFNSDVWWSVGDGLYRKPKPHFHFFKYCVEYTVSLVGGKDGEAFAVCVSLDGTFDLQVATTSGLVYTGAWRNDPFVGSVIIGKNHSKYM